MKSIFELKYFLSGFLVALLVVMIFSCKKAENPVESQEGGVTNVDVKKIDEGAKASEDAFKSGSPQEVISILTDDAKTELSTAITKLNSSQLKSLGVALESKKLDVYGELYAEYSYVKGGVTYTIAYARQQDGTWKLMRF